MDAHSAGGKSSLCYNKILLVISKPVMIFKPGFCSSNLRSFFVTSSWKRYFPRVDSLMPAFWIHYHCSHVADFVMTTFVQGNGKVSRLYTIAITLWQQLPWAEKGQALQKHWIIAANTLFLPPSVQTLSSLCWHTVWTVHLKFPDNSKRDFIDVLNTTAPSVIMVVREKATVSKQNLVEW